MGGARYVFAALFACAAGIPAHTEVLWWYGASYAAVRKAMKYTAGRACSSAGHALTPSPEAIVRRVLAAGRRDADLAPRKGHGLFDARAGRAAPLRAGVAERARRRGLARASVDLVRARPRQFLREEHGGGLDEALEARARGGLEHGPEHGVRV